MTLQKVLLYYRLEDFGSKTKYFREYLILFLKPKQHILHITFVTRSNRMFIFDKTIHTCRNYWRHKINTSKFVKYLKRNTACIWHHLIFTISFYCNFQHKNFRYLFLQKIYFLFFFNNRFIFHTFDEQVCKQQMRCSPLITSCDRTI